jgi:hypothetical protein
MHRIIRHLLLQPASSNEAPSVRMLKMKARGRPGGCAGGRGGGDQGSDLASLNAPDAFTLAVVRMIAGFAHQSACVRRFVRREPGFAETAVVFKIDDLMSFATHPG